MPCCNRSYIGLGDANSDSTEAAVEVSDLYALYRRTRSLNSQLMASALDGPLPRGIVDDHEKLVNTYSEIFEGALDAFTQDQEWEVRGWLVGVGADISKMRESQLGFAFIPVIIIVAGAVVTFFVTRELINAVKAYRLELARQEQEAQSLKALWARVPSELSADDAVKLVEAMPRRVAADLPDVHPAGIFDSIGGVVNQVGSLLMLGALVWGISQFTGARR